MKGVFTFYLLLHCFCSGSNGNNLNILPIGNQRIPTGKNLFLTCKAQVSNPELVKELKWYGPNKKIIPEEDRIYTEELSGDPAINLFIKGLREQDSGEYTCTAIYANNEELMAKVTITTFIGITWEDAPTEQHGIIYNDYKIRCVVRANPPATIDWLKDNFIISTGHRYVIETDGLLLKNLVLEDAGTYTCRARVPQTGALEERDITLDVQIAPKWIRRPESVVGIEFEKAELICLASGSPTPTYTWVNQDGKIATEKDGWTQKQNTGTLIAYQLKRTDIGTYKCIAENAAGRITHEVVLNVILRPKIQELYNTTVNLQVSEGKLICKASGDPLPEIIWKKWSNPQPFILGGQPNDDRIVVSDSIERAPQYTEGEDKWKVSQLKIREVQRSDDGLYECHAKNTGGSFFKSGHIQVEFAPTFEEMPNTHIWSWDQNPVNLTCIATAIPNATITWWIQNKEIDREIIDRNYRIEGHGPRSDLIVTPLSRKYYGRYICKAFNPYGTASIEITLEEARRPSRPQQAIIDSITATTISYRFVTPGDSGGLPIDSYAVEYKEVSQSWSEARRRIWPPHSSGIYILENLHPMTTYDFRFAAKNHVGFSENTAELQIIMPERGPPESPLLKSLFNDEIYSSDTFLNISSSSEFELGWIIPEDNGVPIDFFEISYFAIMSREKVTSEKSDNKKRIGNLFRTEVPHPGTVRYLLSNLRPNLSYLIELRAHNALGYSPISSLVILTNNDINGNSTWTSQNDVFTSLISQKFYILTLIVCVLSSLILLFCLTDLMLCKLKSRGFLFYICVKRSSTKIRNRSFKKQSASKSSNIRDSHQCRTDVINTPSTLLQFYEEPKKRFPTQSSFIKSKSDMNLMYSNIEPTYEEIDESYSRKGTSREFLDLEDYTQARKYTDYTIYSQPENRNKRKIDKRPLSEWNL